MSFIKELFCWFFHGAEEEGGRDKPSARGAKTSDVANPHPAKSIVETILNDVQPQTLMDELNAIEPPSRPFEPDKEDLVRELKELAPSQLHKK